MRGLLLLFVAIPIIEMWLLITVGGVIGALPTIALVLLTACIGLALLRYQGSETLLRARTKLQANELPAREMADTLFFAIGGALLLTPGFVTDAFGFACLTPGIRTVIIQFFAKQLVSQVDVRTQGFAQDQDLKGSYSTRVNQNIIEGDYERHTD